MFGTGKRQQGFWRDLFPRAVIGILLVVALGSGPTRGAERKTSGSETHMTDKRFIDEFRENLGWKALPEDLEKLIVFLTGIDALDEGDIAESFAILIDDKTGLSVWSSQKAFLDRLHPFAAANGSGSFYAIWDDGSGHPLNQMPIVVFGDEGGEHIVAENLQTLWQLLSYDVEISVDHDDAFFYRDEDAEESPYRADYLSWLKKNYGFSPISSSEEAKALIDKAQAKYQKPFEAWAKPFFKAAGR
jgi:hypothetical protein